MDELKESRMQQGERRTFARAPCGRRSAYARRARSLLSVLCIVSALLGAVLAQAAGAAGVGFSLTPSKTEPYAVCGLPTPGHSACLAILVPTAEAESSAAARSLTFGPKTAAPELLSPSTFTGSGVGGGYDPADLRSAYDLPSESAGSGQTVAVIDAYDDPKAESDLGVYRSRYGLPACTTANGCFKKVNQTGGNTYPEASGEWAVEISLDLDMVSAACSNCHILLVEAASNEDVNLYTAEDEAATLGATEITNSWGGKETSSETSYDTYFHHTGVLVTASAGDSGYKVEYPAASQYVISVGGTALTQASNSRGWSESVWGETTTQGTGSGCSAYETKPAWQTDSGCSRRTDNDIAAVASPATPVSLADSYELPKEFSKPEAGWTLAGGTSASSPLIAGTMALANAYTKSFSGADALYLEAAQNGTGALDDVTSGKNGTCGTYLCEARIGYDGPTGLGSPYGAPVVVQSPTVVTDPATSVTQTTATLNATVNPGGGEVSECRFEYGTTNSYGSSAACTPSPGSGSSPVAVSASLTGLSTNTTYHFRISATNAGGTSKGSDETFKNQPPTAPIVLTGSASAITQTTATLNATVNPNGAEVSECRFEYGTTNSYGSSAACTPSPGSGSSPVAVSASLTGLSANTTYHFRISATNAGGPSRGSDETVNTLPNAPAVVTKAASPVGQTTATLNATVNPNGGEVSECKLEYGTTNSYGSSAACTPSPGSGSSPVAVSASPTGLSTNTTYHFRISATNAGGTSRGSDETFKTGLFIAPSVLTGSASAITQTSATLNATVNPNGAEVSECKLEYGLTPSYGSSAACSPSPGSGSSPVPVSAAVGGLSERATYHFRISATSAGGTSRGSDETLRTLPAVHYYENSYPGGLLAEGEELPVLSFGQITLTPEAPSSAPPTTCEESTGGFVENPPGGGAGGGETQSFASWNCANAGCPAGTVEFPPASGKFVEREFTVFAGGEHYAGQSLPWSSELFESGERVRDESKGVVVELACVAQKTAGKPPYGVEGEPQLLSTPSVCSTTPTNLQVPENTNGLNFGPALSKLSFDKESGRLLCKGPGAKEGEEIAFEAATSGSLKLVGFKASEIIISK